MAREKEATDEVSRGEHRNRKGWESEQTMLRWQDSLL